MYTADELEIRAALAGSPRADELIACLEGEIAKRDEELAACRVAVENCEAFRARIAELESRYQRDVYGLNNEGDPIGGDPAGGYANDNARLRAELSALKAQEPVAWPEGGSDAVEGAALGAFDSLGQPEHDLESWCAGYAEAVYAHAAPVSEAKAQGVVMPEPDIKTGHGYPAYSVAAVTELFARLRAAPVQQVVPDASTKMQWPEIVALVNEVLGCEAHKYPCERGSIGHEMTGINFNSLARIIDRVRYAAPAAPAADAWIPVSERLPDVPDGDEREVIVCVKRAHNGQSYSFSARYLNNFPLYSDYEDGPMFVTGWHDVKEHADYDGWYSTLIDKQSGDEVTHWMPLPAAPIKIEANRHD